MLLIQVLQISHLLNGGVPQALANPRKSQNKSNEYTSKKESVKKSNPLHTLFE